MVFLAAYEYLEGGIIVQFIDAMSMETVLICFGPSFENTTTTLLMLTGLQSAFVVPVPFSVLSQLVPSPVKPTVPTPSLN